MVWTFYFKERNYDTIYPYIPYSDGGFKGYTQATCEKHIMTFTPPF